MTQSSVQQLIELLGFDPRTDSTKEEVPTLLQTALDEVMAERRSKKKETIKTQINKAMELAGELDKKRNEYEKANKKAEDELMRLVRGLLVMQKGLDHSHQQETPEQTT